MTITRATTTHNFANIARAAADPLQHELTLLTLSVAVPINIAYLSQQGGPNDYQIEAAQGYISQQKLGEAVQFASKDETREQMRILCEICAIMAFSPGGVSVLGLHFEAQAEEAL